MSARTFFVAVVAVGLCFISLSEVAQIYFFGTEAKSPVRLDSMTSALSTTTTSRAWMRGCKNRLPLPNTRV